MTQESETPGTAAKTGAADAAPKVSDDVNTTGAEPAADTPKTLEFTSDAGAARSAWIAGIFVLVVAGWMGSGFFIAPDDETVTAPREAPQPVAVAVTTSLAETVTQFYQAEGQALPDRDTILRAETSGDVVAVLVAKGEDVAAGEVIARLDPSSIEADANRAAEELASAQREFDNAQALLERGVATQDRVTQARATLASAQAQVIAVEQAAEALSITAPFDGRIETLDLDTGEFVSAGAEIGRLVDITPLTVAIQVPQQSLTRLAVGQNATVRFITGEERDGVVTFVGSSAASETRTFLAEIEVANADGAIPAGISAEVIIPTGNVTAHFLAPSIVSLDTEGALGVKTVEASDVVAFYPIEIVKAQIDGVWVTGLPDTVELITVGQGYVNVGETVAPAAAEPN